MAELSLWAESSDLVDIRCFVEEAGRDLGLDDSSVYALQLAVDEACTNVIMHAYEGRGGRLDLYIDVVDDRIKVVIRDWGRAFDPSTIPAPDVDAPLEQRPIGGVGLFLMRQMMDRVDFQFSETDGNTLIMAKRLHRRE